jgi:MFS family permease
MISFGTIIGSSFFGWVSEKIQAKKKLMILGAMASCTVFMSLLILKTVSLEQGLVIFFLVGFLSSTQVLGYPLIAQASPSHLKGTAMGVASLVIMGSAFIMQPVTGLLLDWRQAGGDLYQAQDFIRAFTLFPIAFLISALLALFVKEAAISPVSNPIKTP